MANEEQVKILKQGADKWNRWVRSQPPDFHAELDGAALAYAYLERAELRAANLHGADLCGAHLTGADLSQADLNEANLRDADLTEANLWSAYLNSAKLTDANLTNANLNRATLIDAQLLRTNLSGANLGGAQLNNAFIKSANLSGADFTGAELTGAILKCVDLERSTLRAARLGDTMFLDVDISDVKGLETCKHYFPSTIGIDTIYRSQGKIPASFMEDAGVSEEFIQQWLPTIRCGPPIQWHSCFISYSAMDEQFARRLHERMRAANMRVWFAPEDLEGGRKLHEQLFQAIQLYDKLLLVLSPNSLQSPWVLSEIRKAREVERREDRRKLFPIRLMDYERLRDWTCFDADTGKDLAKEVREYFIPDFSNWKNHDAFEESFAKLLKDLKKA